MIDNLFESYCQTFSQTRAAVGVYTHSVKSRHESEAAPRTGFRGSVGDKRAFRYSLRNVESQTQQTTRRCQQSRAF
jgi:uncharacterized membrane protein